MVSGGVNANRGKRDFKDREGRMFLRGKIVDKGVFCVWLGLRMKRWGCRGEVNLYIK